MNWPNDVDGDVFRRLEENGLDFGKKHVIDFTVEFENWPPSGAAVQVLQRYHPSTELISDDEMQGGYALLKINGFVNYELVTRTEQELTDLMMPFGGRCDGWGVLYDPNNP